MNSALRVKFQGLVRAVKLGRFVVLGLFAVSSMACSERTSGDKTELPCEKSNDAAAIDKGCALSVAKAYVGNKYPYREWTFDVSFDQTNRTWMVIAEYDRERSGAYISIFVSTSGGVLNVRGGT